MIKSLATALSLLFLPFLLSAQMHPVCHPAGTPAADDCSNACWYCALNGYSGTTALYTPGAAPGFCSTLANDLWLGSM